jgi:hypothetical protein
MKLGIGKLAGGTLTLALLGGVVVYYEHIVSYIKQYAGVVGSIGPRKTAAPPDLKLPNPSEAIKAGKGKGAAYADRLLSPEAKAALEKKEAEASVSAKPAAAPSASGSPAAD